MTDPDQTGPARHPLLDEATIATEIGGETVVLCAADAVAGTLLSFGTAVRDGHDPEVLATAAMDLAGRLQALAQGMVAMRQADLSTDTEENGR